MKNHDLILAALLAVCVVPFAARVSAQPTQTTETEDSSAADSCQAPPHGCKDSKMGALIWLGSPTCACIQVPLSCDDCDEKTESCRVMGVELMACVPNVSCPPPENGCANGFRWIGGNICQCIRNLAPNEKCAAGTYYSELYEGCLPDGSCSIVYHECPPGQYFKGRPECGCVPEIRRPLSRSLIALCIMIFAGLAFVLRDRWLPRIFRR